MSESRDDFLDLSTRARLAQRTAIVCVLVTLLACIGAVVYVARKELALTKQAQALKAIDPEAVARAARVLKLVTAEITQTVHVQETSPSSFRPDVTATVELPVRFLYGSDLSGMEASWLRVRDVPNSRPIVVARIPRPRRIAVEPLLAREQADVTRSMFRFGESEFLSGVRSKAPLVAQTLDLGPKEQARIDDITKEQFAILLRAILRDEADVVVEFLD